MPGVRCFVGIGIPGRTTGHLLAAADAVRKADRGWNDARWVCAENLHVTLRFIGDVERSALAEVIDALDASLHDAAPATLSLGTLRAIPSPRHPRMLWVACDDLGDHARTARCAVDDALRDIGIAPEDKPFRAHITLCRTKARVALSERAARDAERVLSAARQPMSDLKYTLFSSRLTPAGPVYSALGSWPKRGA